jgi:Iron-containing alcohol dehydrogenase
MTTTFNAAATKTVRVNGTNFEFTFTRLERIAFGPGKITTLGAELERMGATRALVATGKTLGASPLLERVTAAMGPHCAGVFAGVGQHVPASSVRALVAEAERVGADALVAFGGGSPIDACKVAAASLLNRRDMTLVAGEIDFDGARSGFGRELSELGFGEFVNRKLINLAPAGLPPSRRVDQSERGPQP